ncbi:MAG: ABC transporter permease [Treponema sp.]|jgi:lipoprotein-releasing system permease protein|nr:ABC transporter permease [Treponema sp.]
MNMRRMNVHWIGFVASRYVSRGRRNSPSPVLAVLGIATGVLALIVIIAVMNGFQLGFIESILEISSYHMRVENFPPENAALAEERLSSLPGVLAVSPFREFQGLMRGRRGGQQAVVVRGIGDDTPKKDRGFGSKVVVEAGNFDLSEDRYILLGAELARRLQARLGDEVTLFSIAGIFEGGVQDGAEAEDTENAVPLEPFIVRGIFRTGFYEYDISWAFIGIESAASVSDGELSLGVKLGNRWEDRRAMELAAGVLAGIPGPVNYRVTSWRDYNRAFFGALRTEKLFMFILVGLIFIVVGLNIFQAQRRSVLERREEIGLLRAVGAADRAVRLVFVWDGVIIGLTGSLAGLVLGLLTAFHISAFFTVLEGMVNLFIRLLNFVSRLFGGGEAGEFAVFSPAVFYIKEIPSRVIAHEVLLIFMFGFLSALLAAWFASGKIAGIKPAEVLRYE